VSAIALFSPFAALKASPTSVEWFPTRDCRAATLLPIAVDVVLRAFVIAASICALLAADVSVGAESSGRPVYAITNAGTDGRVLTRRDPATLAPIGPSARLNSSSTAAAFSPDGSLLAFVEWAGARPSLRVLDLSRMRWRAEVPLGFATGTVIVRWLNSRRALVFAEQPDGLRVLVLDTIRNRLSIAKRIAGHLSDRPQVAVGRTRAAVLIRAVQKIGPVRIAVVPSAGSARIVTLKQIHEGAIDREIYRPSLVADPSADQAYVVGGIRDPVAAINLRTLAVSYRRPMASADASDVTGAERMTVWLGGGRFAVAGWDDGAPGSDSRLLGLRVVSTRSWRARTLDPDTDYVCVAGHSLVGHHSDGTLVVFGFDGLRRLELTPLDVPAFPVPVASNDRYLYLPDPGAGALVADLVSRRFIGRLPLQGLDELLSPTDTLGAGCR
jgi:hypothetical protein